MDARSWTTLTVRPVSGRDFERGLAWLRKVKGGAVVEGDARLAASYDASSRTWTVQMPQDVLDSWVRAMGGSRQQALWPYRVEEVH